MTTPNEALVVTQAAAWLRECRAWLYSADLYAQCPMEADPLNIADALDDLLAAHRTKAERGGDTTPTCWLYTNSEGHRCVQFAQGLMDLNHWTETPLYASPPATDVAATIPHEVAEQVLAMGRVEWGATAEMREADHIEHLTETLRYTRKHFDYEDIPVKMHGLYLEGAETVLCHTGTSPNSGSNARALAGAWNKLHEISLARQALGEQP